MPGQQLKSVQDAGVSPTSMLLPRSVMPLLQRSGAMQSAHSGRTLFDHLAGTYRLLSEWGQPQAVCLAGLFHSIYGTNAFLRQSLQASQRPELQAAIGQDAEALAWLFCNIDRPTSILRSLQKGATGADIGLATRRDRPEAMPRTLPATWAQVEALAEIECANLMEQGSWGDVLRALYCAAMDQPGALSESTVTALHAGWVRQLALPKTSQKECA